MLEVSLSLLYFFTTLLQAYVGACGLFARASEFFVFVKIFGLLSLARAHTHVGGLWYFALHLKKKKSRSLKLHLAALVVQAPLFFFPLSLEEPDGPLWRASSMHSLPEEVYYSWILTCKALRALRERASAACVLVLRYEDTYIQACIPVRALREHASAAFGSVLS